MKKRELIELNAVLNQLKEFGGTKFKYSILKNISLIKPHLLVLEEIETSIKDIMKDFDSDRNNLILEIGVHNPDGTVSVDQNDKDAMEKFNEGITQLLEKHKESINNYNVKLQEFNEILNEEVEEKFTFREIDVESCPEENVTAEQLILLLECNIIN